MKTRVPWPRAIARASAILSAALVCGACSPELLTNFCLTDVVPNSEHVEVVAQFAFDGSAQSLTASGDSGPFVVDDSEYSEIGTSAAYVPARDGAGGSALGLEPDDESLVFPTAYFVADAVRVPTAYSFWVQLAVPPEPETANRIAIILSPGVDTSVSASEAFHQPSQSMVGIRVARYSSHTYIRYVGPSALEPMPLSMWGYSDVGTEHTDAVDRRDDAWFHVLCGQDALGYARFYLNGILVASSSMAKSVTSSTDSLAIQISAGGPEKNPVDTPLAIDDLILLDSPVSQAIADRLYEGTLP